MSGQQLDNKHDLQGDVLQHALLTISFSTLSPQQKGLRKWDLPGGDPF